MPTRESAAVTEPVRSLHIDYSVNGLRTTARYSRTDIAAMAKPTVEAKEAGKAPRYAVYGVWVSLATPPHPTSQCANLPTPAPTFHGET